MSLKISFARALQRMAEGQTLKASEIRDKSSAEQFVQDGVIQKFPSSGNRFVYRINDKTVLENYLNANYYIKSLESYIELNAIKTASGQDSLKATHHTKEKRTVSMPGFFIKAIQPLSVNIHEDKLDLPFFLGTEIFVSEPEYLYIPENYTIVGVENPEVFRKIARLEAYFKEYEPCLFVLRYMSKGLPLWLSTIPNFYIHFGDFDMSGLQIYISEYKSKLNASRCNFFIPANIETLIQNFGSKDLYEKQRNHTKNIDLTKHPEIKTLGEMINRHGKGLEQEILFF